VPLSNRRVENAVSRYAGAYPDVEVRQRLVAAPAGPALVAESVGAALVVVGFGARGRLHRALYGSVRQEVLHSATSPVVIVRTRNT
jgi:nucleotide-binding universal stress UspA family protein